MRSSSRDREMDFWARGDQERRAEFTEAHCQRLQQWYNADGIFVHPDPQPGSREHLWNCHSLLAHGSDACLDLATNVIANTAIDHNGFQPQAAIELYLMHKDRLPEAARDRLLDMVKAHLLNAIESRFGSSGVHNFTTMYSFLLMAASETIDYYDNPHPFAGIPEIYTGKRLVDMGLNSLKAIAYDMDRDPLHHEYNSPTYTPITLMALAKIVELVKHEEARQIALDVEQQIWRETLTFFHPELGMAVGPYSRAYRVDMIGQSSQMRHLMCYLGLSKDESMLSLLDSDREGLLFHHDGDIPFMWSGPAWLLSTRYHIPADAIAELNNRRYPHRISSRTTRPEFGYIDPVKKVFISVQNNAIPEVKSAIIQHQEPGYAVGWRSHSLYASCHPLMLHYALRQPVSDMADTRTVVTAHITHGKPQEWTTDPFGKPIETMVVSQGGRVQVSGTAKEVEFNGCGLDRLALLPIEELAVNTFMPVHFSPISKLTLNDQLLSDPEQGVCIETELASLQVEDGDFRYSITYTFDQPTKVRVWRWANFIRFAGIFYEGEKHEFSPAELDAMRVRGKLTIH